MEQLWTLCEPYNLDTFVKYNRPACVQHFAGMGVTCGVTVDLEVTLYKNGGRS